MRCSEMQEGVVSEQLPAHKQQPVLNAARWRNIVVMVSRRRSKLHEHFQDLNESFGKSTCEDLKKLKQEKLAADLHAAVAACLQQQYWTALVSMHRQ